MEWLTSPEIWVAFLTLTALEIVLGIDNIIFISILVGRLPKEQQAKGRFFGLALAMGTRILLLLSITWVMRLTADLFHIYDHGVSGRDLILFFGGLFLLFKSTMEIWHSVEGEEEEASASGAVKAGFVGVILQIAVIDIIFSLDSVITAVGLVENVPVMIAAIMVAFLIVVGTLLVAESFGVHVPKGYVYFAMAFSLGVESINIRMRKAMNRKLKDPVKLGKDMPD
jgi:predicted tellurium resistance membrane protein TerC